VAPAGEGIVGDDEVAKAKQGALRSQPIPCCTKIFPLQMHGMSQSAEDALVMD